MALAGWLTAFISQAAATAKFGNGTVGTLWFAIFLQLAVIGGVLHTLASDSIAMNRLQISVFTAVALVFAVNGVNAGIFSNQPALQAMGAGWLLLSFVDILWALYFTSEEDSLILYIFNSLGTGGLTPPSRNRHRGRVPSVGGMGNGYGYQDPAGYGSGTGIGSGMGGGVGGMGSAPAGSVRSGSFANKEMGGIGGDQNRRSQFTETAGGISQSPSTPLMSAANVGDAGSIGGVATLPDPGEYKYRAKALYAYQASPDDPNEISFTKGEILDIVDTSGKWWQAKRANGETGIAPSNYLQII
jgi:SHO1 osmosensor